MDTYTKVYYTYFIYISIYIDMILFYMDIDLDKLLECTCQFEREDCEGPHGRLPDNIVSSYQILYWVP